MPEQPNVILSLKDYDRVIIEDRETGRLYFDRVCGGGVGEHWISFGSGTFNRKTGRHVSLKRQIVGIAIDK